MSRPIVAGQSKESAESVEGRLALDQDVLRQRMKLSIRRVLRVSMSGLADNLRYFAERTIGPHLIIQDRLVDTRVGSKFASYDHLCPQISAELRQLLT